MAYKKLFTDQQFVSIMKDIATNYKTLYVLGGFGWPASPANKTRAINAYPNNAKEPRKSNIQNASADTFFFDCVCLIKAVLWGWNGNKNADYGGAVYGANGVPDTSESGMIEMCSGVSTDFSNIVPGEAVWLKGHIGVYIGDGLAVEASPAWSNKVQITACNQDKKGYNRRNWTKHGKLPWITYQSKPAPKWDEKRKMYQQWLNENYHLNLTVDGRIGPASIAGTIEAMQKELNNQGECLAVDGRLGPATQEALQRRMIKKGDKGKLVFILQGLLYNAELDCNGFDGSLGAGCEKALKEYQAKKGIEADGKAGPITFLKLVGR